MMRLGVDFDNTIAGYDEVFVAVARDDGLIDSPRSGLSKREVRDLVKARPDGETDWIRLQSRVYGRLMHTASVITGFEAFLRRCGQFRVPVYIVSHKTEYGRLDPDQINLRHAAVQWMKTKDFFNPAGLGLLRQNVYFEETRGEKIERIAKLGCTHFVDDLEEVLSEPGFPERTERFLLAGNVNELPRGPFRAFRTWREIEEAIFSAEP